MDARVEYRAVVGMDYVVPQYPLNEVDDAGRVLIAKSAPLGERIHAFEIVENWRASHHYPLNGMSVVLKKRATHIFPNALAFQRLKRLESITKKLNLRRWITLSKMQDIGGCRAVMNSVENVYKLRDLYVLRPLTHEFVRENDYIDHPKKDGYRGVHRIYHFVGRDRKAELYSEKGMKVEIQLRTQLQHYWATAVETAETFTRESMKSRIKEGELTEWEEFFALVSSCFASQEDCPGVPGMPDTIPATISRLRQLDNEHHFCNSLESYKVTAEEVTNRNKARYFLLELDPEAKRIRVTGFKSAASRAANEAYMNSEQAMLFADVKQRVLVSVDDIAQLKRAYPNYYLDTTQFVKRVKEIIS